MKVIIQKEKFWENLQVMVDIFTPITKVLRLVDSDMPTTGKIYHAMYLAQEALKEVDYGGTVSIGGVNYTASVKKRY